MYLINLTNTFCTAFIKRTVPSSNPARVIRLVSRAVLKQTIHMTFILRLSSSHNVIFGSVRQI